MSIFLSTETSLVEALERDLRQNDEEEEEAEERQSVISKSKLVARLHERIRELETRPDPKEARAEVPVITIEKAGESIAPKEQQIIDSTKYQDLEKEKKKLEHDKVTSEKEIKTLKSELNLLRKLVSQKNLDKEAEWEVINERMNELNAAKTELETDRDRMRKQLIETCSVPKELRDVEEILRTNPDESAYVLQAESLKKANNVLQRELNELMKSETELKQANDKLWKEKAQWQKVLHPPLLCRCCRTTLLGFVILPQLANQCGGIAWKHFAQCTSTSTVFYQIHCPLPSRLIRC